MIDCNRFVKPSGLALIIFLTSHALANEPTPKAPLLEPTRIHFQVEAQEKVAGNTMQATLRLEVKNRQPASAAKDLNQRLQETMQALRTDKTLHVETSQYQTQQLFDEKGRAKDWQVSVELTISSEQWNSLSEHIAALQNKGWLFSNVNFEVSPEQRKAVEKKLIQRALSEWTEQADLIAKQMQLKKWHIGNVEISHQGFMPHPPRILHSFMSMKAEAAAPAPDMAGADTAINITVNGELIGD